MLPNKDFKFLSLLSWICSFVVVLYHYVWFFEIDNFKSNSIINYLVVRQEYGANFVWLYWAISGFIFTYIVLNKKKCKLMLNNSIAKLNRFDENLNLKKYLNEIYKLI